MKLKSAARIVQARLGLSYQGSLHRLRAWDGTGIDLETALANVPDGIEPPNRERASASAPRIGQTADAIAAASSREELASVLGPIRRAHDEHRRLDPACPFCTGDIT